jgi:hypothetical protein
LANTPGSEIKFEKPVYVTRLNYIYGRSSTEIESLLGLPFGHLAQGWDLLFLVDPFSVDEFEMRGAAWFSDGVPSGHTLPKNVDRHALQPERALKGLGWKDDDIRRYKEKQLPTLAITGRERLTKVLSHKASPTDPSYYPPGTALGQWAIAAGKRFRVQATVEVNELPDKQSTQLAQRWKELIS